MCEASQVIYWYEPPGGGGGASGARQVFNSIQRVQSQNEFLSSSQIHTEQKCFTVQLYSVKHTRGVCDWLHGYMVTCSSCQVYINLKNSYYLSGSRTVT